MTDSRGRIPTLRGVTEDALRARLDALSASAHRQGDTLRARGFCHDGDEADTLSFEPTEDGRNWRVKCFKGCEPVEVIRRLQADERLATTDGQVASWTVSRVQRRIRPGFFDSAEHQKIQDEHEALLARPDVVERLEAERRITLDAIKAEFVGWRASEKRLTIPYGSPLPGDRRRVFQRDRWQPPQYRHDGAPKVLAESQRARWLYVPHPWLLDGWAVLTEGAMDALAVASAGVPAIGAPSGTDWNPAWTDELISLKVTEVYVPHDRDEIGQKFAAKVKADLEAKAITVYPVELPGDDEHADVTDHLRRFESIAQGGRALLSLCREAEPKPDGLHFIDAADVHQEPQNPLLLGWGQRVPEKVLTLLLGREGRGKTTLACQLAADVSNGGLGHPPRTVLFLSHEDGASIMASRLEAAGADMRRVKILSHVQRDGRRSGFRLPRDEKFLVEAVEKFCPALIVLAGSLMSHVEFGRDYKGQTDMRAVLEPLHDVAGRFGAAVLAVVHPNKSRTADPGHLITGSAAIIESARSALLLEVEEDDDAALVLAHFKANNSAKEESLTFRRESVELPSGIKTVQLVKTGTSKLSAVELISKQLQRTAGDGKISQRDRARNLLEVLLGDHQPHPVREIRAKLDAVKFGKGTIDRAREDLGVVTTKGEGFQPEHFWTLPEPFKRPDPKVPNDPQPDRSGDLGELGVNGAVEPNLALAEVQGPQPPVFGDLGASTANGTPTN